MMKAYDRVKWHFLEAILLKQGFSFDFFRLIMKCVSSVRFTVRMNGELMPFFTPSRGLRQGDPMSPFLFLFCGQGLTCMLNSYGGDFVDRGIKVSPRSPWVNHLLFADDSLIFISASARSVQRLNDILAIYAASSGQAVNRDKSVVFFSPNTPAEKRLEIKNLLAIHVEAFSE